MLYILNYRHVEAIQKLTNNYICVWIWRVSQICAVLALFVHVHSDER